MGLSIAMTFKLHPDVFHAAFPTWLQVFESENKPMPDPQKSDDKLPAPAEKNVTAIATNVAPDAVTPTTESSIQSTQSPALEPEAFITELPEDAVKGEQWAWQLSVSMTIIQHGIAPTFTKALEMRQLHPDLSQVRIVPQFIGNESQARFALVSGPYNSKAEAEQYLKLHKTPKDSWVRGAGALQDRLLPKSPDAQKP
jgi:hypothetical protein